MLLENGCPLLEEEIDCEGMGPKWYRGLSMPLRYYPGMDDRNHANWLHTISPWISPAKHEIPIPPPSTDMSKMLWSLSPPTKGKQKEMDECNVAGILMDLGKDGSEEGTSTPTRKDAGAISPAPTKRDACMMSPAPTEKEVGTTLPTPTTKEAGTTREQPTDPK